MSGVTARLSLPIPEVSPESGFLATDGQVALGGPVERVELWVDGAGRVPAPLLHDGADGEPARFTAGFVLPRGHRHLRVDLFAHLPEGGQVRVELPSRRVVHRDALVTVDLPLPGGGRLLGALDLPAPGVALAPGEPAGVRGWVGAEGHRVERVWIEMGGQRSFLVCGRARVDVAYHYPAIVGADRAGFVGEVVAPTSGAHADLAMWAELDDGARVRWLTRRAPLREPTRPAAPVPEARSIWTRLLPGWARTHLASAEPTPEVPAAERPTERDPEGDRGRDEALQRLDRLSPQPPRQRARLAREARALHAAGAPVIGLLLPLHDASVARVDALLRSLEAQLYGAWRLWALDDGSSGPYLAETLARDPRVTVVREARAGVDAIDHLLRAADAPYLAALDPDLRLPPDALLRVARALAADPELDLVYGDEVELDAAGRPGAPLFRTPFNPTFALGVDGFGLTFHRRALALEVGGYDDELEGAHAHDLWLRMIERRPPGQVRHVPHVIAQRSRPERPPSAHRQALTRCVSNALARRGYDARAVPMADLETGRRIVWSDAALEATPVTMVIPTRDRVDLLGPCVDALRRTVPEASLRVLIVDDESQEPATHAYLEELARDPRFRVLRPPGPRDGFNFARLVNFGVEHVETPLVLLLNNDCEALRPGWLAQMVGWTRLPDVGVVGARLLYADGTIQHAGVTIGVHGGLADHLLHGLPGDSDGYLGLSRASRDASAVTGACLLTPVALYRELGGLDEAQLGVDYNDIDYCLRAVGHGRRVIYAAEAELRHLGSASRGIVVNPLEKARFVEVHGDYVDPFVSPALDRESPRLAIDPHRAPHTAAAPARLRVLMVPGHDDGDPASELHDLVDALATHPDVELTVLRRPSPHLADDPSDWRREVGRIAQAIDPPDVVLAHGAQAAHGVELARQLGVASVYHLLGREMFEVTAAELGVGAPGLEVLAQAVSAATRVVFSSPHVIESYRPLDDGDRYRVLPVGVSVPRLEAFRRRGSRAALRSRHGFGPRETILALVPDAGAGATRRAIREVAPDASVLELDGALARPARGSGPTLAREDALLVADVVLMTHGTREVFPRVLLEAMAFHRPVVGPWIPGVGDVIGPDVHGFMVDMRSTREVATVLERLLADEALRHRVGDHAAVQVRLLLDSTRRVGRHVELLREAFVAHL